MNNSFSTAQLRTSTVIDVQSVSDFNPSLQNATYLIRQDISGNVTLGADCLLVFQGGKLTSGTITGNRTRIEAPLTEIFGSSVQINGSWHVPVSHPEWFTPSVINITNYQLPDSQNRIKYSTLKVADDATRLNKAFKLLMPGTSADSNTIGGKVLLTGVYRIYSMVKVPRHIYIEGADPALTRIYLPTPSQVIPVSSVIDDPDAELILNLEMFVMLKFEWPLTRLDNEGDSHFVRVQAAMFFMNAAFDDTQINKGCGARDFRLIMNTTPCHGVYVEKAYDQSVWENVEVEQVNLDFNAFRFTISDESLHFAGQTLLLKNCIGYHKGEYPQPATGEDPNLTPVFYFHHYQETNIIGCKAFINTASSTTKYGGVGFHFEGCRGIVMDGCSAGFGLNGIMITASSRTSSGITITGLTSEEIENHDVWAFGSDHSVAGVTVLPIRHQLRPLLPAGDIWLENCYDSFVVSTSPQQIVTLTSGTCNMVISTMPLTKTDNNGDVVVGTVRGNTNLIIGNYDTGNGLNVQDRLRVHQGSLVSSDMGFDILRTESSITTGSTGLYLGVHNGTQKTLRVMLGQVNADGSRPLVIQDNDPIPTSGLSSNKPSGVQAGFFYYATNLNKPIWYTGSGWVDANGNTVN